MSLTRLEAIKQIESFQSKYLPHESDVVSNWTAVIDSGLSNLGRDPASSMKVIVPQMIRAAGLYENAFPSHPVDMWAINNGVAYANSIAPTELLAYFYPTAAPADHDTLLRALSDGTLTSTDFLSGWLPAALEHPQPSAGAVLQHVFDAGLGHPALPALDLGLPGVTDAQVEFLIGIYVAAFDRAPEHTGLVYWANDLAGLLAQGQSEPDAMKHMAKAMYLAGAQHGEQGTALDDAAYVQFVYDTVLDRTPDPGGAQYWTEQLQAGADRSTLIAVFLTSALGASGDGHYLQARIAVAEYAAQAHVSGPGSLIDLAQVIDGVATAGDAYLAIQAMAAAAGANAAATRMAPGHEPLLARLVDDESTVIEPAWADVQTPTAQADILLVGIAPESHDNLF